MPNKLIFEPGQPFAFSWSRFSVFLDCPKCFYLDNVKGIIRPSTLPLTLNLAVDKLLKSEFDIYRANQQLHPLLNQNGINLIPYQHPYLEDWRDYKVGIRTDYNGYTYYGAIDDIWHDQQDLLYIVDYKSTAKSDPIASQRIWDREYYQIYLRQLDFYNWLFLTNGFNVSNKAYFVFANGDAQLPQFNGQLTFNMSILEHDVNTKWIEPKIDEMIQCLSSSQIPPVNQKCKYCKFAEKRKDW